MSEIKALEKLRKLKGEVVDYRWGVDFDRAIDELDAEIKREWMRVPVDADGVPCRPGEKLRGVYAEFTVCSVNDEYVYHDDGRHWDKASKCRHVKPRTLEEVLCDFGTKTLKSGHQWGLDAQDAITECADEIRAMFGEATRARE